MAAANINSSQDIRVIGGLGIYIPLTSLLLFVNDSESSIKPVRMSNFQFHTSL